MTGPDDRDAEKLAPVTYLFGAQPADSEPDAGEGDLDEAAHEGADERAASWAVLIADTPETLQAPSSGPVFRDSSTTDSFESDDDESADEDDESADEDDVEDLDDVPDPEGEADRAHNVALHALARRGVSVSEMKKLLLSRDLDENTVEIELERLLAVDLLNDGALAETLVRSLQERKGLGKSGVTAELRRRGIEQEAITLALETEDEGDDEAARALELALKRAPQLRSYDNETAKRRLSGFLMRRGYSGQVVSAAVKEALEGGGSSGRSSGSSGSSSAGSYKFGSNSGQSGFGKPKSALGKSALGKSGLGKSGQSKSGPRFR